MALGRTVPELHATISADERRDWRLFDNEEPIGNRELRMQLSELCAMFFNANRGKDAKSLGAETFLFRTAEQREQQSNAEILDTLRSVATPATGSKLAKFKRRKRTP